MNFCKDCAHYAKPFPSADLSLGLCSRKKSPLDPVTGLPAAPNPFPFCKVERINLTGYCGHEARFFEPKEVPNV